MTGIRSFRTGARARAAALALACALGGAGCEAEVAGSAATTGGPAAAATSIELVTSTTPAGAAGVTAAPGPAAPATAAAPAGPERFGAPLSAGPAVPLDDVVRAPEKFTAAPVKVVAKVAAVCKKKGCWMTLAGESGVPDPMVRVTFKDYGFFMPKDSEGARVTLEGTVTVTEEPEEISKHYAEDEGKDPTAVTGPRKTIAIEATGVEMLRTGS